MTNGFMSQEVDSQHMKSEAVPGGVVRIITERLVLRAFTQEDVEPMHRILGGPGVLRYFPKSDPPSRDRVREMILGQHSHWRKRGYGLWAVQARSTGDLMGRSGLQYLPETDEVEVDFILGGAHWGQGFATEAGQASLRYGFEEISLESVVGIVHPENAASRHVLEKLGMTLTGPAEYFGMACYRYAIERLSFDRVSESWKSGG
jgi:RimJ/RimL family protein N-acetyltransferase